MRVIAMQGCKCPRIDPRVPPIDDSEPADVPDIAYYRRRVADGSLRLVETTVQPAGEKPKAGKEKA